jgi:hypothetical protein
MIYAIDNFLETNTIENIIDKFESSKGKAAFEINDFGRWDSNLSKGNFGPVYMLPLDEYNDFFHEKCSKIHPDFANSTIITTFLQIWTPGSGINWHTDLDNRMAATIYLNKSWDWNWGGLFLFKGNESDNSAGWINPTYNRCVWFKSPLWHSVSLISRAATEPRISIQLFFQRNN